MFNFITLCIWWLPCAIISLSMMCLTIILSPLLALFITKEKKDLPWYLAWFGQWDDDLCGTVEGLNITNKLGVIKWIIRNPSQYFDYWVMGQTIKPGPLAMIVKGDPDIDDAPIHPGWCLRLLKTTDRLIPNFRLVWKWPFMNKCVQIWLGWQYPDTIEEMQHCKAQLKFTLNPFSKIEE